MTPRLPRASTLFGSNFRMALNSPAASSGWPLLRILLRLAGMGIDLLLFAGDGLGEGWKGECKANAGDTTAWMLMPIGYRKDGRARHGRPQGLS